MAAPALKRITYAEYLIREEASVERHAYADGETFAMAGGTRLHAAVQARLLIALGVALKGRRCVPYGSDLRIYLPHIDEACYADVTVVCGKFHTSPKDPDAAINPTVITEVLSTSSEAYDRGRKFEKYRGLASLREYVLLAQDRASAEVFRRDENGNWVLHTWTAGGTISLMSIDVEIAMDELYAGVFDDVADEA